MISFIGYHYVDGKRTINIIVEALQKLQITSFIDYANAEKFKDLYILRKPNKAELSAELKTFRPGNIPTSLPEQSCLSALIIDFIGYARKVPVKTQNLKNFLDLVKTLCKTFLSISSSRIRLDIIPSF